MLKLKADERRFALSLLCILAINTLVYELSDVVATSGFVSNAGPELIPWLWALDAIVIMGAAAWYSTVVDRIPRTQIVSWIFGIFAVFYLLIQLSFSFGAPQWLSYLLLYIINDQQLIIFPLAFWSLANDVYTISESKRLFPLIGAGYTLGSIAGNVIAGASAVILAQRNQSATQLLTLSAALLIVGAGIMWFVFRNRTVRARQTHEDTSNLRETLKTGADFFANVESFRYLAVAILLGGLALTIIEYHFLFSFNAATTSNPLEFQKFYSLYNVVFIVTTLAAQWLITGRILEKVNIKNSFVVFPVALAATAALGLALPGIVTGIAGRFFMRLVERVWDEPSRKSLENLIPDERRGRVSAFMDSYFYAIATLGTCVILGILFLLRAQGWLTEPVVTMTYLSLAFLAAIGAIIAAVLMRRIYEKSLLNWRLARSRRKSALDGIEF